MDGDDPGYVHGYRAEEAVRLADQAATLEALLHDGTRYCAGNRVLEVGCGVGAQTVALARNSPGAEITAIDIAKESVAAAQARVREAGLENVRILQADLLNPPFAPGSFDHLFVCFVLEHLHDPLSSLLRLKRLLRPGGSVTVIEGDHGVFGLHPDSVAAREAVNVQIQLQQAAGGDPNIGRRLFPLMAEADFRYISVRPLTVYVDGRRPDLADGFTRRTFTAMIQGVRAKAISAGLIQPERFDEGIEALLRAAEPDGTFIYTFFKGDATVAPA